MGIGEIQSEAVDIKHKINDDLRIKGLGGLVRQ